MSKIPPAAAAIGQPPSPEESDRIFAEAKRRGEHNVQYVCDVVQANELERQTIARFEALVRHGYKFIDLHVRKDGQEYKFEADWLARLFRRSVSGTFAMRLEEAKRERGMKLAQLLNYRDSLAERDDVVAAHARAVADGRIAQLEQDLDILNRIAS